MAAAAPHTDVMGTRAEAAAATTADLVPLWDCVPSRVKLLFTDRKPLQRVEDDASHLARSLETCSFAANIRRGA